MKMPWCPPPPFPFPRVGRVQEARVVVPGAVDNPLLGLSLGTALHSVVVQELLRGGVVSNTDASEVCLLVRLQLEATGTGAGRGSAVPGASASAPLGSSVGPGVRHQDGCAGPKHWHARRVTRTPPHPSTLP